MEKTAFHSTCSELVKLRERAQREIDETVVLIGDYQFLQAWWRMRPRARVIPSSMLDD